MLPHDVGKDAKSKNSYITQGVRGEGSVTNSVLFTGAVVGKGAKVVDSVIMPGVVIEEGATVTRALVAEDVHIGKKAKVGSKNSESIELVAKNVKGGTK